MDEMDIWRAAKLLVDQHGARAGLWAMGRELQLIEACDAAGAAMWGRIFVAIEELRRTAPQQGESFH
jgi:hypothetical protein